MPQFTKITLAATAILAAVAGAQNASAATLFNDTFDDVASGVGINGRTPTTSFNNAAWASTITNFTGNNAGGISANSVSSHTAALDLGAGYLASNPGVYELSFDARQPSGVNTQSWVGLGFAQGVAGTHDATKNLVDNEGSPWLIFRLNGQMVVFGGPKNTNTLLSTPTGTITTGESHTFRFVLDTTPAQWTLDLFVDGVQQDIDTANPDNTYTFATNPAASRYVAFGVGNNGTGATATVDNFTLTGPVPEPGAVSLALAGIGLLAGRRRRNR